MASFALRIKAKFLTAFYGALDVCFSHGSYMSALTHSCLLILSSCWCKPLPFLPSGPGTKPQFKHDLLGDSLKWRTSHKGLPTPFLFPDASIFLFEVCASQICIFPCVKLVLPSLVQVALEKPSTSTWGPLNNYLLDRWINLLSQHLLGLPNCDKDQVS